MVFLRPRRDSAARIGKSKAQEERPAGRRARRDPLECGNATDGSFALTAAHRFQHRSRDLPFEQNPEASIVRGVTSEIQQAAESRWITPVRPDREKRPSPRTPRRPEPAQVCNGKDATVAPGSARAEAPAPRRGLLRRLHESNRANSSSSDETAGHPSLPIEPIGSQAVRALKAVMAIQDFLPGFPC